MAVTRECGFCKFQHPGSYKSTDERMDCDAYSNRGLELYEQMDANHLDVVEKLDEYQTSLSISEGALQILVQQNTEKCSDARIMWTHELQYDVLYIYSVNWFCKEVMILWEHFSFDILMFFIAL